LATLLKNLQGNSFIGVSENRVLRRISGPKREKMARGWRRLHNEELHNLYASLNTIRAINSRRMRWTGYVARMREGKMDAVFWLGNLKGRDHLEDLSIVGKMILECILRKQCGKVWIGFIWLRIGK
jgi:hypothetical protein